MNLLDAALLCLSLNIYHEARGEPREGQLAVAYVTLTRAKQKNQPVCKTVYDRKQFGWANDIRGRSKKPLGGAWKVSKALAHYAYMTHVTGTNKTKGATFYHERNINPKWAAEKQKLFTVGNHIFYRNKGHRNV